MHQKTPLHSKFDHRVLILSLFQALAKQKIDEMQEWEKANV